MRTGRISSLLYVLTLLLSASSVWAEGMTAEQAALPVRKLSRGLANATTGVLELPLSMLDVRAEEGPIAAIFWGSFVGVGRAVVRTAVGLLDTATFLLPIGTHGYEPMLQPEFLLQPTSS